MLKISLSPTTAYNELGANEVIIDVSLVSYIICQNIFSSNKCSQMHAQINHSLAHLYHLTLTWQAVYTKYKT